MWLSLLFSSEPTRIPPPARTRQQQKLYRKSSTCSSVVVVLRPCPASSNPRLLLTVTRILSWKLIVVSDIHPLFGFFCNPFMDSPNHCAGVDWGRTEGVYCSRENNNNFSGIIQLTETRGGWVWCFYLKVELILFFWISSEIEWERAQLNQLWTAAC